MAHRTADHRRHHISVPDVRAMLRLGNDLHATVPEGENLKLRLLEGVRELTGAEHASASVATFGGRKDSTPVTVSIVNAGITLAPGARRAQAAAAPAVANHCSCPWSMYHRARPPRSRSADERVDGVDWCTTAAASPSGGGARREHCVHSFLPLAEDRVVACLTVRRSAALPRFSSRERSIVCSLHAEAAWIYRADVVLASSQARALAPRERETLQHLLAGKSEKQIALEMRVSYNTVHHYVKALHKHFRVSTRSELLARQSQ